MLNFSAKAGLARTQVFFLYLCVICITRFLDSVFCLGFFMSEADLKFSFLALSLSYFASKIMLAL